MTKYIFNDCAIDTDRHELVVRGRLVEVQPLVFATLAYLARHPRRVVDREEMLTAVWRSPVVSESVVARVIMKARRAIRDDAASPITLINVRGVGYRLDAEVITQASDGPLELTAPSAPARRVLGILPFIDATRDEGFAWTEQGLTCLAHFRLGGIARLQLVPLDAVFAWRKKSQTHRSAIEPLEQACAQLGADAALRCVIKRSGMHLRLESAWGADEATATKRHWIGSDLVQLVNDLITVLEGEFSAVPDASEDLSYWHGQLARVFAFERKAQPVQALTLLEACLERLPVTAPMLRVQSRLLRARARHDAALQAAERAMQLALADDNIDEAVACRLELALVCKDQGHLGAAEEHCALAMRLVSGGGASGSSLSQALWTRADVLHYFGLADEGVVVAERAAAAAAAVGDTYGELTTNHLLGKLLTIVPAIGRSVEVLLKVIGDASRREFLPLETDARITLGTAYNLARRYAASIEAARRAGALARSLGDEGLRMRALATELFSLIESGNLEEPERLLGAVTPEQLSGLPVWLQMTMTRTRAHLAQRQGKLNAAISMFSAVLDEAVRQRWYNRWSVAARLCHLYIEKGDIDQARAMSRVLAEGRAPMRLARARAAIALAEGDRVAALNTLRVAWATEPITDAYGQDVSTDLAWMLLEDGAQAELDFVMAHVLDMSTEHAPTRLVQWVYANRRHESTESDESCAEVLRRLPNLARRFPWLAAEAAAGTAGSSTAARRLPMLLSSASE